MKAHSFSKLISGDARLKAFNDTVPAGIVLLRVEDGTVVFTNRTFNDVFHTCDMEIVGANWHSLFVDESDREKLMVKFVVENEVRGMEVRLRAANGEIIWGLTSLSHIPVGDEELLLFAFVDISAQKRAEQEIQKLANHDPLTKLPNLRLVRELMAQGIARSERNDNQIAILFVDLDNFKTVNDTLGHDAGDATLREVAARLKSCVRDTDTVARIGGDEFVIVLEEIKQEDITAIGDRIVEVMRNPIPLDQGIANIGASVGVSIFPRHGNNIDKLIQVADQAMYRVKKHSKNAVAFA